MQRFIKYKRSCLLFFLLFVQREKNKLKKIEERERETLNWFLVARS